MNMPGVIHPLFISSQTYSDMLWPWSKSEMNDHKTNPEPIPDSPYASLGPAHKLEVAE